MGHPIQVEGLRSRTGDLQETHLQPKLEVHEAMTVFASLYTRTVDSWQPTTHYIEEAEKLCDRVAIVDEGRIIAIGTPREIQEKTPATSSIELAFAHPLAAGPLPAWTGAEKASLDPGHTRITVTSTRPARTIVEMVKWMGEKGFELADIRIKRPSQEDALIELTGKSLRE